MGFIIDMIDSKSYISLYLCIFYMLSIIGHNSCNNAVSEVKGNQQQGLHFLKL